jgi:hypothetical protein
LFLAIFAVAVFFVPDFGELFLGAGTSIPGMPHRVPERVT